MERMRIMVVDDNTVNLATLEQELKETYEVIPMLTGRRAIKYLYREHVDLILLDVQMPIMDGIETLKEIRTLEGGVTVPVIFLTARKDAATVIAGSELGIMDYITKPFDPIDLRTRIDQVFKRLGVLPMEKEELFNRIQAIADDIREGNKTPAIKKTEEVLRYQIDEEVSGRMRVVKKKLEADDIPAATSSIERVITLLEREFDGGSHGVYPPISLAEISTRLLYVLDDIANFKLHDANDKLSNLKEYDISDPIRRGVNTAIDRLNEFDDDEAISIINSMLNQVNTELGTKRISDTNNTSNGSSSGQQASGSAYRSKYWNR